MHTTAAAVLLALAAALAAFAAPADARRAKPVIESVTCVAKHIACPSPDSVYIGGHVAIAGQHIHRIQTAVFHRVGHHQNHPARRRVQRHLRRWHHEWIVHVPRSARHGRIYVRWPKGGHSKPFGPLHVIRHRPAPDAAPTATPAPYVEPGAESGTAFDGQGMWIWYLAQSDGGDLDAIAARAHAAGVSTVYVKSSDGGSSYFGQFSAALVQGLHARGLKVCAWPFVYGLHPVGEADLSIRAIQAGADCLVIDAEGDYEGRYAQAQTYMQDVRDAVGPSYPIGLASFPYVDYHPAFPYSVFLGPGGAQFNLPQMYWKAIGTSVDAVYAHTLTQNRIYRRPVEPLGQTYDDPPPRDIERFRELAKDFSSGGLSFFSWQANTNRGWDALAQPITVTTPPPAIGWPVLSAGDKGDEVIWLQEHLASFDPSVPRSGVFDAATKQVVMNFQAAHGLQVDGVVGPQTWPEILALTPVPVDWTAPAPSSGTSAQASSVGSSRGHRPASASLPPVRNEIPPRLGAGGG